jgi:alkanesulfonate monooxygenase SsuD/methylene tetrahydromethanopterin reductase-like flavin-dependent oxidoreductase (luciferase family)
VRPLQRIGMFSIGITDHLEGARERPSKEIFDEVADLVRLAGGLGVKYAWFAEHHAHAHLGHMPAPLLLALHLAGQAKRIHLGTAIICLNLHHAPDVAEQVATADVLSGGRMAVGFGSGSTPEEARLFGLEEMPEAERHEQLEAALKTIVAVWRDGFLLPAAGDLAARCWVAVNSVEAARIAGRLNFHVLFSHLRTPGQYREYIAAYRAAGGSGQIAANRPVFVGKDDQSAIAQATPALRILWRRFQREGKIPAERREPESVEELCAHPINFVLGGPETVQRRLRELHDEAPFDVLNAEVRWEGLPHAVVRDSLRRLAQIYCAA